MPRQSRLETGFCFSVHVPCRQFDAITAIYIKVERRKNRRALTFHLKRALRGATRFNPTEAGQTESEACVSNNEYVASERAGTKVLPVRSAWSLSHCAPEFPQNPHKFQYGTLCVIPSNGIDSNKPNRISNLYVAWPSAFFFIWDETLAPRLSLAL